MKSCYVKEQKRYSLNDLTRLLDIDVDKLTKILRRLRQYGILKIVKNTKEEIDRTDLLEDDDLLNEIDKNSNVLYVFNFVGVFVVYDVVFKCYPKYVKSEGSHEHLKKVMSVLEKYNSNNQIVPLLNILESKSNYNLLAIMVFLIRDYIEYGPYQKLESVFEINGSGETNWDKTINETFALVIDDKPFYPDLITKKNQFNKYDYFKRLHQAIVTNCSNMLENTGLLDLFSLIKIEESEESISNFGNLEYILYELEKEMNTQFNTRLQFILKLMYAYLSEEGSFKNSDNVYIFGTSNFKHVWEVICQTVLDNDLKKPLGDLSLPSLLDSSYDPNKDTLLSIIEKPCWNFENPNKSRTDLLQPQGTFIPDCVKIDNNSFNIYDAKYYVPEIKGARIVGQPGIEDVSKQFIYQKVYKEFISEHKIKGVKNYFLIPTEDKCEDNVYVSMNLFNEIGLENINVKFVVANDIFDAFLEGKTNLSL